MPINNGESIEAGGNRPFFIDDKHHMWIVESGSLDIFAILISPEGREISNRKHVCTVAQGDAAFGAGSLKDMKLLAVGEDGTRVVKIKIDQPGDTSLASYLDSWVERVAQGMTLGELSPRNFKLLEPGRDLELEKGDHIVSVDDTLWVSMSGGKLTFPGAGDLPPLSGDTFFPLTRHLWLQVEESGTLKTIPTKTCLSDALAFQGLETFHQYALMHIRKRLEKMIQAEQERLTKKELSESRIFNDALESLAAVVAREEESKGEISDDALMGACQIIGNRLGIEIKAPMYARDEARLNDPVNAIARASGVRIRAVSLSGTWWKQDNGPLLAFRDGHPVALLQASPTSYRLVDNVSKTGEQVTAGVAASLDPQGYTFYKPFPEKSLNAVDLLKFGLHWCRQDLAQFLVLCIAVGMLGMLIPVATGIIFNHIIPEARHDQLTQIVLILVVGSLSAVMFQFTQSLALLRIGGKMNSIQAALWDRLLALPPSFFRKFTTGDLAQRSIGIAVLSREVLTGIALPSLLAALYASFNFLLLFYYYKSLAIVAMILSIVIAGVIACAVFFQVRLEKAIFAVKGRISGLVFQILNGISKIRIAGAERRAFARWAEQFKDQKRLAYKAGLINNVLTTFNTTIPVIVSVIIFTFVTMQIDREQHTGAATISTGNFLAFNAALTAFIMSVLSLGTALISLTDTVPLLERARPILETLPEVDHSKYEPGELNGDIEMSTVSFRYKKDGPLVLQNISFHAKPGEFIAFVGPSGSGKTTILRLLLGFETPEGGSIHYDGENLEKLNLQSVRAQTGAVLQTSTLISGEIFYNIVGSSLLTLDDAWEAARKAGIDEDIRNMPMGMHTYVSEDGTTFSGGQKQRLLIARAIARKPRIILFDEATSALDNRTQALVTESLRNLNATRIVIAHRLSTIINADRVYVVMGGKIVQSGDYHELIATEGPFKELAKRQLS
jgi:NHLM bacteriocin system ABC transporter ATP-binding protein